MAGNQITFGVGFNVNEAGLNKLKQSLQDIQKMTSQDLLKVGKVNSLEQAKKELQSIKVSAAQVETALNNAFNKQLGTLNVTKFNQELKNLNIAKVAADFDKLGVAGRQAFSSIATQSLHMNTQLKQSYTMLDKMKETLTNTIKWNVASAAVNSFTRSISSAFNYVKVLDASLTDIRIVTGQSREEMAAFAVEANNAAQALGRQTKEYTNAALAFYQQGLNADEVRVRTEASLKAQNITGAGTEIVDELTAVWNGFKATIADTELYVDKLAAVADSSASNLSELATGMSKAASVANNMGVSIDQLTAQLATIIATTRQAPQTVGNALKTIYARINDIKAGTDDAEISLGNYTSKMASLGINVLDASGRLRETGEVMEEIGAKWSSMTREQQVYLAQTMAGQRQMNNLVSLFDNWEKYSEMLNVSLNAQGALNEKNARYMDSISAHINQFKAAIEGMQDALISEDAINSVISAGTKLVNLFTQLVYSANGFSGAVTGGAMLLTNLFSKQISSGIETFIFNLQNAKTNINEFNQAQQEMLNKYQELATGMTASGQPMASSDIQISLNLLTQRNIEARQYADIMTDAEKVVVNSLLDEQNAINQTTIALKDRLNQAQQYYNSYGKFLSESGALGQTDSWKKINKMYSQDTKTGELSFTKNDFSNIEKASLTLQNLQAELNDTQKELIQFQRTLNSDGSIENLRTQLANLTEGTEEFNRVEEQLAQKQKLLNDKIAEYRTLLESGAFGNRSQEVAQILDNLENGTLTTSAGFRQLNTVLRESDQELGELIYYLDHTKQDVDQLKQQISTLGTNWEKQMALFQNKAFAQGVSQMLQGVSQLAFAASTLSGLVHTIEGIHQGTISLGDGITRLVSGFTMLALTAGRGWKMLGEGALKVAPRLLAVAAAEGAVEVAGVSVEATNLTVAQSFRIIGASVTTALTSLLPYIAVIGGIALIIWGIVQAYNAETKALEKAQKKVEEAQNRYKELKDAYDELKSSLEDYQAAQNAIDQLTIGTQEWRDALADANQQVLELLSTYPELAKYLKTDNNGRLTLSQEGQDTVLANARRERDLGQRDVLLAQAGVTSQQGRVTAQDFARKFSPQIGAAFSVSNVLEVVSLYNQLNDDIKGQLQQAIAQNNTVKIAELVEGFKDSLKTTSTEAVQQILALGGKDFIQLANASSNSNTVLMQQIASLTNQNAIGNEAYLKSSYQGLVDMLTANALSVSDLSEEAIQRIEAQVDDFTRTVEELMSQEGMTENIAKAILSFSSGQIGDFSSLTKTQRDQAAAVIQSDYDKLGFATQEAAEAAVEQAAKNYEAAFNQIVNNLSSSVQKAIHNINTEDLSLESAKLLGQILTKAFQTSGVEGLDKFEKVFKDMGSGANELLSILANVSSDLTPKELAELLSTAGIKIEDFGISVLELSKILGLTMTEGLKKLTDAYSQAKDVIDDLQFGDGISQEDADKIKAMGIELSDFFIMGADGSQILIGKVEELQSAIDQIHMSNLYNEMVTAGTEANKLANVINNMFTADNEGSALTYYASGTSWDSSQLNAQLETLNTLREYGHLDIVTADKLDMWKEAIKDGNETVDIINAIGEAYDANKGQRDLLLADQQALVEEWQNSAQALASFKLQLDEDIDTEEWENLTEYLSDTATQLKELDDGLETNRIAAARVSQSILRFDDAIQDVTDHYEDWIDALNTGSMQSKVKAFEEMRDAYGDMLDMDGSALSEEFLTNTKNLELMKQAAEGNVDAYDDLMEAARQDIAVHVGFDDADFQSGFEDLLNKYYQIDSLDNLKVGAELNDEGFLAALSDMVTAAGMTAEQATDYLASMGVDAQVVENTVPTTETKETGDIQAQLVPVTGQGYVSVVQGTGMDYSVGAVPLPYTVYGTQYTPITQTVETTSENKAVSLQVTSAHKSSGGGFKYKQATHGGGGGGGKKGSGGGGGGGSKPKKPNKPMKAKIDPYHDVNIKIGDTQEAIDKLQKERDKLIGKPAIDNLTKQINLMEREKELLQEKAKIAEGELQRQGQELANLGAIFNANGDIANYKQLLLDKQNQVNKAIEIGNTLEGDERDAYDEYIKDLEQQYKDLEAAIKEYDETMQLVDDLEADYQDIINDQIKLAIEAFDLKINVELDLKDAKKEFNEFRKKIIDQIKDDDFAGLAQNTAQGYASYYNIGQNGVAGGIVNDLRKHAQDIQHEIQIITNGGFSQVYGNDLAAAADDLKKYNDELMDALEEAQEIIDETHDHFLDAIDAMNDAFDTQQENFDKLDDLLSHDMEILQLIHGEENYDELANLWQQQVNQDNLRLQALQNQQQYWQDKLNEYEKDTDEWKKAMENWQAAFEATNEAMITSVQNLQSQWENSINSIMSKLRNQTFGGNMDAALEDWDKMTWHSDRYLDSIDRANGLLELQNKYIDMINKTNDPKLQAKLAELEEKQLDALANKEHLREIDLKLAQQQLTVLQAQMALEDAQQAKTKLRLRRDSQGNYTYQYVADEDNIQEKTQEYLKALNDYRTTANDSLHQDLEDMKNYYLEFLEKAQDAQMKYGDDAEALAAEMERLTEMYLGEPDGYIFALHEDALSSMTDAQEAMFANLYGLNDTLSEDLFKKFLGPDSEMVAAAYDLLGAGGEVPTLLDAFLNDSALTAFDTISDATQEVLSGEHGLLPEWSSVLWDIADQYEEEFVPDFLDAMLQLQTANQIYVDGLATMQAAGNRTTEQIALGLAYDAAYTNALDTATQALLTTQMAQVEASEQVYNSLKKNEEAFKAQSQAAIDAANSLFLYWLALNGQTASGLPYSVTGATSGVNIKPPTITSPSSSSAGSSAGYTSSSNSGGRGGSSKQTASLFGVNNAAAASYYTDPSSGSRFATGGYTGSWNDNPKLAWLDQKELVLNSDDTRNILSAVDIVRAIAEKVGNIAGAATAGVNSGSALDLVAAAGQTILQDVIINADFPAVQDAAQIKQAFNELVNLASQRASGNRRTY